MIKIRSTEKLAKSEHNGLCDVSREMKTFTIDIKKHKIPINLIQSSIETIPEDPFSYETWDIWTKSINEKNAYISIILGLAIGLLFFPSPDFSKSILIGILLPVDFFPDFISQSLLFLSFLLATFVPIITWKIK